MPDPVDATLAARIAELVDEHRPELAQLVDAALDQALEVLVGERIAARNGARDISRERMPLCSRCGERPRVAGRTVCGPCRHARARERRAKPSSADDVPR